MPISLRGRATPREIPDDPEDFRATLVEHLEELRDRIIRCLMFLGAGWIVGWYTEPWLYTKLEGTMSQVIRKRMPAGTDFRMVFDHIADPFVLKLKLSFMIGLVLTFPFIVLQLWGFVAPGLKPKERKAVRLAGPASLFFFALGAFFCWLILPSAFTWFTSYMDEFENTSLFQQAGTLVFLVLKMMLAFGVGFQLPLVVFVLGKIGLLSPEMLLSNWRQATIGIFIISAVITPSNDIFSMLMMAVPLSLLFVLSVYAIKYTSKKKPLDEANLDVLE
jgi:sec-independent protein translocase protein TatC